MSVIADRIADAARRTLAGLRERLCSGLLESARATRFLAPCGCGC